MGLSRSSKQKQSSNQLQQSWDYGNQQDAAQQQFMQNMWGAGQNLANSGAGMAAGQQGYDQGMGYLGQAMGQLGNPYMQGAQQTLQRLQNPGVDPMVDVYSRQIGQQFNEQIMPGLRGDAAAGGGLGSSRAGIAQALAGSRMGQQLQDFGAQLYGQNQDRALQAASQQGQLGQGLASMYGQGSQQAQALGQYGMGIPWYAQQQMAGLLGPAIMQDKGGYTYGTSTSKGKAGGGWGIQFK